MQQGERLVLIVDGADEAENPGPECMPWQLPRLLPENVHVVCSYRMGHRPAYPVSPSRLLRIDRESPDNRADLRSYVERAVEEEAVAAKLAEAGVSPEHAVAELTTRTGGVWVYLRYVLSEIRTGRRAPDNLSSLPGGLSAYYAGQLRRWQHQERAEWESVGARLLSTLVAAREPVALETLLRLAGLAAHEEDRRSARRWCDVLLRPFLSVERPPSRTYRIYHASARDYFGGHTRERDDVYDEHLALLAEELAQGVQEAHSRIAEHYVCTFGGFEDGLPHLANDPALAGADSGYALRHLTFHMQESGRSSDMHRLLAARYPVTGPRARNSWFESHRDMDALLLYLEDVQRAEHEAGARTDREVAAGRPAGDGFVDEVRCFLLTATAVSVTNGVGPELLEQLVKYGVWDTERGLVHARLMSLGKDRGKALLALCPYVPQEQREILAAEALKAYDEDVRSATATRDGGLEFHTPAQALPYLSTHDQRKLVRRELEKFGGWPLGGQLLVPYMTPEERARGQASLLEMISNDLTAEHRSHPIELVGGLLALLPYASEGACDRLLSTAMRLAYSWDGEPRAKALGLLLPHFRCGKRAETLRDAALAATAHDPEDPCSEGDTVHTGAALLAFLPAHDRSEAVSRLLRRARSLKSCARRAYALACLLPHLANREQQAVIDELLASKVPDQQAMAELLPWLGEERRDALSLITLGNRADIPPYVTAAVYRALRSSMLAEVTALMQARWSDQLAVEILPHLCDSEFPRTVQDVLRYAREDESERGNRAEMLARVMPYVTEEDRAELYEESLDTLRREEVGRRYLVFSLDVLKLLRRFMPDEVSAVELYGPYLDRVAVEENPEDHPFLISILLEDLPVALLDRALDLIRGLSAPEHRFETLAKAVPRLAGEARTALIAEVLAGAESLSLEHRAKVLVQLLPYDTSLEGQAVEAVRGLPLSYTFPGGDRCELMAEMLPAVSKAMRQELAEELLQQCRSRGYDKLIRLLPRIAAYLDRPPEQLFQPHANSYMVADTVMTHAQETWSCTPRETVSLFRMTFPPIIRNYPAVSLMDEIMMNGLEVLPQLTELVGKSAGPDLARTFFDAAACWQGEPEGRQMRVRLLNRLSGGS
jgi:hypothetical protein